MKKIYIVLICIFIIVFSNQTVYADTITEDDIYQYQLDESNANNIIESLPNESKEHLDMLGINQINIDQINSIDLKNIFNLLSKILTKTLISEKIPFTGITGIIIISSLINSFKSNSLNKNISDTTDMVITISIISIYVIPIVNLIVNVSEVISSASSFMMAYTPIMTGLIITQGQAINGASYYSTMIILCQWINHCAIKFLIPTLNILLGLSIVGSISDAVNLKGLCSSLINSLKWFICFIMSIFVSFITLKGIIGSSADTTTSRALRFAIRSFIPVIGNAISDAYLSIHSCINLLKSGVGIVTIISTIIIFLPILMKCTLWLIAVKISYLISDILNISSSKMLSDSIAKVLNFIIAIILSCLIMFVISTAAVLLVGGK